MQGSDFIIKNKSEISRFFEEHDGMEFIDFKPTWYDFAKIKLNYYHFFVDNKFYRKNKILKVLRFLTVKIEKMINISRNIDINIYSGSALFSITNELCDYFLKNETKIFSYCRHSLAADGVIFQSLVMDSPFRDRLFNFEKDGGNLYYIDYKRQEGNSPTTFDMRDFDELCKLPDHFLFVRKFLEVRSKDLLASLCNILDEDAV